MDFLSNKINQPFNPNPNYLQGLSNNIQNRIGIEIKNVVEVKAPKIEFNKKQKPIQLTVEFGFPLTAEKNNVVESTENNISDNLDHNNVSDAIIDSPQNLVKDDEIGQIHIEPIQLAPNANPYWHNFNSDDELEGLVLDSEGQEMSDITINGDAMFDIDQHFFQKAKQEVVEATTSEVKIELTPIVSENISTVVTDEIKLENDTIPVVNEVELMSNEIPSVVSEIKEEESVFSFSFVPETAFEPIVNEVETIAVEPIINEVEAIAVEPIINEVEAIAVEPIVNEVEAIAVEPIVNEVEAIAVEPIVAEIEFSFSDADLDNLHDQMSQQIESVKTENPVSEKKNHTEVPAITFVDFSTNEIAIDPEREYTDAELDMLHEQLSKEIEASKPRVSEPASVAKAKVQSQPKVEVNKTVSEPVLEVKPSIMEMIPWSSVFGIVASLMAVASAWFIWNSIQKPIAIDEFIDSKIAPMVSQVNTPSAVESIDNTLSLAPADFIANEILSAVENPSTQENNFNFVNLSEQSKISAVVLESNGLTTLELEDGFFEDLGI